MKTFTKDIEIINEYEELLNDYIRGEVKNDNFQYLFMNCGKNDLGISEKLYDITQELFYDVEEFCIYPELRDEGEIDEEGLMKSVKRTLRKLQDYKKELEDQA